MFVVQQAMRGKMDSAIFSKDSTHGRRTACLKIQRLEAFSHGDDCHYCICFVASVDQTIEMNCSIPGQSQISSGTSEIIAPDWQRTICCCFQIRRGYALVLRIEHGIREHRDHSWRLGMIIMAMPDFCNG